jgi:hypothetical protein
MSRQFVTVATFTHPIEAQLAAGRLEEEGIEVFLGGDLAANTFSGMSALGVHVELRVREEDGERAHAILATPPMQEEEDPNYVPYDEDDLWLCTLCGDANPLDVSVCPACQTPRESLTDQPNPHPPRPRVVAEPANPEAVQKPGEVMAGPPPVSEYDLAEDDLELPPLETFLGDSMVNRAYRAALFGCITLFPPFTLYALWLLFKLLLHPGEVSPAGMRRLYWTLFLVACVLAFWFLIYVGAAHLYW